jgi:hypothetical protein
MDERKLLMRYPTLYALQYLSRIAVRHGRSSREHRQKLVQFSLIVQNFCATYGGMDTLPEF